MKKEFVSYELALRMKQLGFDWPCYAYIYTGDTGNNYDHYLEVKPSDAKDWNEDDLCVSRPLFQQAFRWFREKGYLISFSSHDTSIHDFYIKWQPSKSILSNTYDTYEEAEQDCLEKLCEIVEQKQK
jgi:hypothetical protein